MAQHKITYSFSATPGGPFSSLSGWSESYYCTVDESDASALSRALAVGANGLLDGRRSLLTPGWRIAAVRVVQFPSIRRGAGEAVPPASGVGIYPVAGGVTDEQPYDRVVVRYNSVAGHRRMAFLGGIGSDVVDHGGTFLDPANWHAAWEDWMSAVVVNSLALRVLTNISSAPIQAVLTASGNPLVTPVSPAIQVPADFAASFPDGRVARISGVLGMSAINGQWTVRTSSFDSGVTTIILRPKRGVRVYGAYGGGGLIAAYTASLDNITSGAGQYGRSKKAGRPFGVPVGRRRRPA